MCNGSFSLMDDGEKIFGVIAVQIQPCHIELSDTSGVVFSWVIGGERQWDVWWCWGYIFCTIYYRDTVRDNWYSALCDIGKVNEV